MIKPKVGPAQSSRPSRRDGSVPVSAAAGVFETHVSTIFLVGDRAYKLKKPVRTGFLDFSSIKARQQACIEEIEVNRRFAPDVYLGVASVTDPEGVVCDYLVVMKRMPEERRLSNLVLDGVVRKGEIEGLARLVLKTHRDAPRSALIAKDGTRDALRARWEANFEELSPYSGRYVDRGQLELADLLASRYLAGRNPLFQKRIAEGRIVDGHGDLLADDIYLLDDGPRILDALEFNEHLRYVDVIDDAACLAMDLDRLAAPELSWAFLDAYLEGSGDTSPRTLVDHYLAYRALVRAKVACLRADQSGGATAAQAYFLLRMAVEHLVVGRVMLVSVGGLPGSGKSTLADALANTCGMKVLNSDIIRKELAGISPTTSASAAYQTGIYSREFNEKTYAALLDRASRLLEQGISVILDASWVDSRHRKAAAKLALSTASDFVEFHVTVPQSEERSRIEHRAKSGPHVSDANAEIATAMAKDEHPWSSAVEIDGLGTVNKVLEKMLAAISLTGIPGGAQEPLSRSVSPLSA